MIASDKGLAGAYNSNIIKKYLNELRADTETGIANQTIAIGRRVSQFATRLRETEVVGVYDDLADQPSGRELMAILDSARDKFVAGEVDAVDVVFTEFISSMTQNAVTRRLLPAGFAVTDVSDNVRDISTGGVCER